MPVPEKDPNSRSGPTTRRNETSSDFPEHNFYEFQSLFELDLNIEFVRARRKRCDGRTRSSKGKGSGAPSYRSNDAYGWATFCGRAEIVVGWLASVGVAC